MYGSEAAYLNSLGQMKSTFADEGIVFNPEGQRTGSSLQSHRIMSFAKQHSRQNDMAEELFSRYITQRQWIGDKDVCNQAAVAIGLDAGQAEAFMADTEAGLEEVAADLEDSERHDVRGVPFFIIGGHLGISGAVDADVLIQAFEQV